MNRSIVRKRDFFQGLKRLATAHWFFKNWRNISENDTFPMIKSKGLKLQTTNISSGLSSACLSFACLPTLRFILLKPVIIDSLTALFWRQNIIRYLKTASREIFVCLVFLMYKILEKNTLQLFFYLFLFVSLFSFLQSGLNTFGNHVFDHMKSKRKRTYLFQISAGYFGLRENSVGVCEPS